jgi:hypothetical protein
MTGQRQPKTGNYRKMSINVPEDIYEFIKLSAHAKNLSISAYITQVFTEKKNEILGKKS